MITQRIGVLVISSLALSACNLQELQNQISPNAGKPTENISSNVDSSVGNSGSSDVINKTRMAQVNVNLGNSSSSDIDSVNVNVDHIELFLKKGSPEKRLLLAQNFGMLDLKNLESGNDLQLDSSEIPDGVEITHVRVILNGHNNHAIHHHGKHHYSERCELKTPSA